MDPNAGKKNPVLHHINLKTPRLQQMLGWYDIVTGIRPLHQFEGGAWASNDAANHRVALITSPEVIDDPDKMIRAGMHHVAFEYDTLDDLLINFERLWGLGIKPHLTLDHGMTTSFYYVDPDGNSVELQADNFDDWNKSSDFVRNSAEFKANPIGMPVDPAKMLADRRAGIDPAGVRKKAYAGEYPPSEPMDPRLPFPIEG
ncbi:VOC family protein [Thalassovita taeanensis]|uniref:Glyoxalase/Bleomycin resistance protein/Dioxygenase superfamily protein n=1 Tax=Thalassovita taeanensis TaxID=657014 RepID=A0A1H9HCF8_9RHOB|nr:VOC family protein [Thalassovita taeanensis]SEQ59973.1 Glyoxalase/Bleomycin resistance protein/Dioxygenase superfamily protein [Thalassovita taeanensis]